MLALSGGRCSNRTYFLCFLGCFVFHQLHIVDINVVKDANDAENGKGKPRYVENGTNAALNGTTTTEVKATERPKLLSGWDTPGVNLYQTGVERCNSTGTKTINLASRIPNVTVSEMTNANGNFWEIINGRIGWERQTFDIFSKYVTNETIVVDFGTWIGPTLLYHAALSKHSYGIEADPMAFAVAEYNVKLNADKEWGHRMTLESACVSAPEHVGNMTMRGAKAPGASMSGIGNKVARRVSGSWNVLCYTLQDIFERYWGIELSAQPVVIKIDVESYECKLIPSFYDWLKNEPHLPTMYITFHPEIEDCSPSEWEGILQIFKLYEKVNCQGDAVAMPIQRNTSISEFEEMKTTLGWKFRSLSMFVLSGRRE